jgi:hypothetical protein
VSTSQSVLRRVVSCSTIYARVACCHVHCRRVTTYVADGTSESNISTLGGEQTTKAGASDPGVAVHWSMTTVVLVVQVGFWHRNGYNPSDTWTVVRCSGKAGMLFTDRSARKCLQACMNPQAKRAQTTLRSSQTVRLCSFSPLAQMRRGVRVRRHISRKLRLRG